MSPPDIRWTVRRSGSNPQGPPRESAYWGVSRILQQISRWSIAGEEVVNDILAAGGILFGGG